MTELDAWTAAPARLASDPFAGMADAGLFRIGLEGAGGYAAIASTAAALAERTGLLGVAGAWATRQMIARFFIAGFGNAEQRTAWLPRCAAGACAAVAISEPGVGAHPKHLATRADGDRNGFRITGEKAWVTNGPFADVFVVLAVMDVAAGRKRYGAFLVPRDTPGLALKEMPEFSALRPSWHGGLVLDGCLVPRTALFGSAGTAYETMALPFRDLEDAVGLSGIAGALRHLLLRLAAGAGVDAASSLGGVAALVAVLEGGAERLAEELDGAPNPAKLVGLLLLAAELLARVRAHHERFGPAGEVGLECALADLEASLSVARGPRQVRQTRLGVELMRRAGASRPACRDPDAGN